jgi:predicted PP-loop superfamily ATPase
MERIMMLLALTFSRLELIVKIRLSGTSRFERRKISNVSARVKVATFRVKTATALFAETLGNTLIQEVN